MIGLKRGTVKLVKYDPKWRQNFRMESKKIQKIFGGDVIEAQHVGSTAIPGILAKPIIDIAIVVPSLCRVRHYVKKLKGIGYKIKKDDTRKERLFFTKGPERQRTYYLHIGEIGSSYVKNMVLFRDYLCNNEDMAKKYSALKENLAIKYQNNREIYSKKKEKMIKETIKRSNKSLRKLK
ncbi:GrpB family protein [Patescibacteria group bacterium]|nr:GrpB family protein [Patescibacteria group bacterium]